MPKAETKLEMIRHFAEQDARISKQRALIARMSDYDLPTVQATSLLEDMESVRREIQADRDRLTKQASELARQHARRWHALC